MARLVAVTIKKNGKIVKKKVVCAIFRYYLHFVHKLVSEDRCQMTEDRGQRKEEDKKFRR